MRRDQPIATATIADIYMQQGLLDEAEALYRRLLKDAPGDRRLEAGLDRVRRERRGETGEATGDDALELSQRGGGRVACRWTVSEAGRQRAKSVLGAEGKLTLRLATFPRDDRGNERDVAVSELNGDLLFKAPRQALVLAAAVGLLDEKSLRFVSITHGKPLSLAQAQ